MTCCNIITVNFTYTHRFVDLTNIHIIQPIQVTCKTAYVFILYISD